MPEPACPKPLTAFRECPAYVLLGDPGMGKTTVFDIEERALGENALKVDARDFANFDADDHPEWAGKTLFIDGLDEIRVGQSDPRTPLDRIRRNLDKLGKPHFRLSCRHADWLTTDQKRLSVVSPSGGITMLRLDPFDSEASTKILESEPDVSNAQAFLEEAKARHVEGMLANPQTLTLLVQAVRDGSWPESRTETFEGACLTMATEDNKEHTSIQPPKDPCRILDTAGRLCTALLISGTRGFATTAKKANEDYPHIAAIQHPHEACREASESYLFRYAEPGRAEPIHRHIAEYTAARHIASLIADGLPSDRVLALISGSDGSVVSELRGLSAWLAVHSEIARQQLIERDPTGVALYGDTQAFSPEEQHALFNALIREPRKLEPTYRTARAFTSLATPEMLDAIEGVLANPPVGADGPISVDFVLRVLRQAPPLPGLALTFLNIVRDRTHWPRVRNTALDALIHYQQDDDSELVALLHDVHERRLGDPDDELLGRLLSALYPRRITSSAIWDYFKEGNEQFVGAFMGFWTHDLLEKASTAQVAEVLDACSVRIAELEKASDSTLASCVARLLAKGIESHGDRISIARLYDWLDAGLRLHISQGFTERCMPAIRRWLEGRPNRQLELLLEGIRRFPDDHWYGSREAFQRFLGASVSGDFYKACALAAKSMSATRNHVSESLLRIVVQSRGLEPQRLRELIAEDAELTRLLDSLLEPAPPPPERAQLEQAQRARVEQQQLRTQRDLEVLRANEDALRNNRASPQLLYRIARIYFGDFMHFTPQSGVKRLEELVAQDPALLDAVRTGLLLTVNRDDMPDAETILEHRLRSRMHYLCRPYLAGLAEAEQAGLLVNSSWTSEHRRKALAAYFDHVHGDYEPGWYQQLIAEHPAIVAEVQIQFASAMIREGIDPGNTNLWHLAFDSTHAQVARHASLPLLRGFPMRANNAQLGDLNHLLLAAYQHADAAEFKQLITDKLSLKSMPPRQRGRWIAVGCAVATATFAPAAKEFVRSGRQQARALLLASFFCSTEPAISPVASAEIYLPALLVRLVGRFVNLSDWSEGSVTLAMEASMLVRECIRSLAGNPDADATAALRDLLRDAQLLRWHYALTRALDDQRVIRRNHEYRHPTFEQVIETLNGGAPANASDLTALVLDRLDYIETRMRSGNTDDWKQHWNEDGYGRPTEPKPEQSCTRALLRELRLVLPTVLSVEPEVRYPDDARADIRVSHEDYHVPIEVKRNDNRKLWRAARTQLLAKYANDPATNGHGIYVVLWFGRDCTQRSPNGTRPPTPDDLKQQIENTLTEEERRAIHVCVIDVSKRPRKVG
ncbi:MAG: hypothetical protein OXH52_00275 [Gammaproteobacteria bacterium]|nr:hypothetical protein [Gammaproteobacteria bacterium]